jgi:hypothetical protein
VPLPTEYPHELTTAFAAGLGLRLDLSTTTRRGEISRHHAPLHVGSWRFLRGPSF